MSHMRTSTVPKLWCGRTSHQISRIVLMKPVSTMWLTSHTYSLQFRISGGRPAVGSSSITFERYDCRPVGWPSQNGLLLDSASSVGRCRRMRSQIMTALSPESTPTCTCRPNVTSRRASICSCSTSLQVALVGRHRLIAARGERMQAAPPQGEAQLVGRRLDDAEPAAQLAVGVFDALADVGVDLEHRLHHLRLEPVARPARASRSTSRANAVRQVHRLRVDQAQLDLDAERRQAVGLKFEHRHVRVLRDANRSAAASANHAPAALRGRQASTTARARICAPSRQGRLVDVEPRRVQRRDRRPGRGPRPGGTWRRGSARGSRRSLRCPCSAAECA